MEEKTLGVVIAVKKQWWLKINTKAIRKGPCNGAIFPHVVKVKYSVDGKEYTKRKWISAGLPTPNLDDCMTVLYNKKKPSKAKVLEKVILSK